MLDFRLKRLILMGFSVDKTAISHYIFGIISCCANDTYFVLLLHPRRPGALPVAIPSSPAAPPTRPWRGTSRTASEGQPPARLVRRPQLSLNFARLCSIYPLSGAGANWTTLPGYFLSNDFYATASGKVFHDCCGTANCNVNANFLRVFLLKMQKE